MTKEKETNKMIISTNKQVAIKQLRKELKNKINKAGLEMYVPNCDGSSYGWITNGVKTVYFQFGRWGDLSFSSCYKPTTQGGTGFGISDYGLSIDNLNTSIIHSMLNFNEWNCYRDKKEMTLQDLIKSAQRFGESLHMTKY
jgi:hypothetical protein